MKNPIPEHPIATLVTAGGLAGALTVGAVTGFGGDGARIADAAFLTEARGGLIEPARLASWIEEGEPVTILDTRLRDRFDAGHVPDAAPFPLERIESSYRNHPSDSGDTAPLREALVAAGGARGRPVVVIDEGSATGFERAAYTCWLLSLTDVGPCHVLEGGTAAWQGAGFALDLVASPVASDGYVGTLEVPASLTTLDEMRAATLDATIALVDARGGDSSGSIPGSWRLPRERIVEADGRIDRAALAAWLYRTTLFADERGVVYGASGREGALGWFLLEEVAGLDDVQVFPGGMPAWKTYPHLPIARLERPLAAPESAR